MKLVKLINYSLFTEYVDLVFFVVLSCVKYHHIFYSLNSLFTSDLSSHVYLKLDRLDIIYTLLVSFENLVY